MVQPKDLPPPWRKTTTPRWTTPSRQSNLTSSRHLHCLSPSTNRLHARYQQSPISVKRPHKRLAVKVAVKNVTKVSFQLSGYLNEHLQHPFCHHHLKTSKEPPSVKPSVTLPCDGNVTANRHSVLRCQNQAEEAASQPPFLAMATSQRTDTPSSGVKARQKKLPVNHAMMGLQEERHQLGTDLKAVQESLKAKSDEVKQEKEVLQSVRGWVIKAE